MKIAILCPYSYPSVCGVWNRVYNVSKYLIDKGYEIHVFSSNIIKGSNKKAKNYEFFKGIHIHRFPVLFNIGQGMFFNFINKLLKIKPDIIHTHVYRHPHSNISVFIAKLLRIPCFLTAHAPFVRKELRSNIINLFVKFHDLFLGRIILNLYKKIFSTSHWEIPYLINAGANRKKIVYSPNGIPKELLKVKFKENKKASKILFLGRVAPVKDLATLIKAINLVVKKTKNIKVIIAGPGEGNYLLELKKITSNLKLNKYIKFIGPIYGKKKIKLMNESDIYVLPSIRESMPQALIEAMALGMLVISSDTVGGGEVVQKNNGFIFKKRSKKELAEKILFCLKNYNKLKSLRKNARKFAENVSWDKICKKIEGFYK